MFVGLSVLAAPAKHTDEGFPDTPGQPLTDNGKENLGCKLKEIVFSLHADLDDGADRKTQKDGKI